MLATVALRTHERRGRWMVALWLFFGTPAEAALPEPDAAAEEPAADDSVLSARDKTLAEALKLADAGKTREAIRALRGLAARFQGLEKAEILNFLAMVHFHAGDHRAVKNVAEQALVLFNRDWSRRPNAIEVSVLDPNSLIPLALLSRAHLMSGDLGGALAAARRAHAVLESGLGDNHPEYFFALETLALAYLALGAVEAARGLAETAKADADERAKLLKEAGVAQYPPEINARSTLAAVLVAAGKLEPARKLLEEARTLEGKEASLASRNNLARVDGMLGNHQRAYVEFDAIVALARQKLGAMHPNLARILANRAALALALGKHDEARRLLDQVAAIWRQVGGPEHPELAATSSSRAIVEFSATKVEPGVAALRKASDLRERTLHDLEVTAPQLVLQPYLDLQRTDLNLALTVALENPKNQRAAELAFDLVLRAKGRSIDAARARAAVVFEQRRGPDQKLYRELERIEKLSSAHCVHEDPLPAGVPAPPPPTARDLARCTDLGARKERAREAYFRSATLQYQRMTAGRSELGRRLASGQATERDLAEVEWALLDTEDSLNDAVAVSARKRQREELTRARVTRALGPDEALVEYVRFETHDRLMPASKRRPGEQRLAAIVLRKTRLGIVELLPWERVRKLVEEFRVKLLDAGSYRPAAHALYRELVAPLEPELAGAQHVYIAPDAELALVPFDALRTEKGYLIAEPRQLSYLTTGRDLLRKPAPISSRRFVAFADPAYGGSNKATKRFTPVPSTAGVAREAARTFGFPSELHLGLDASASRLFHDTRGPSLVHIATHGWYADDAQKVRVTELLAGDVALARAGLALAGANDPEVWDGTVTALELAGMDLVGTELAVLATCESGLGRTISGHGAYTLYRSMLAAGAETVVASLWRVNAATTDELMLKYYSRVARGESRTAALRAAMLELSLVHPHPKFWAGFVAYGRQGPLRALAPAATANTP